jgi:hypothetical protein
MWTVSRCAWLLLISFHSGSVSPLTDGILMKPDRQSIQHFMVDRRIHRVALGIYYIQWRLVAKISGGVLLQKIFSLCFKIL